MIFSVVIAPQSFASEGAASVGCDKDFEKSRATFKQQFAAKLYEKAYWELYEYLAACDWIEDRRVYWIYGDLSSAALQLSDVEKCQDSLERAKNFQKNYGPQKYIDSTAKVRQSMTPDPKALEVLKKNTEACELLKLKKSPTKP